jgi:hypothetical protein
MRFARVDEFRRPIIRQRSCWRARVQARDAASGEAARDFCNICQFLTRRRVYILAGTQVQLTSVAFGEGCEVPQISVHGLDAYYRDEGSGIPVLLGHSSTGSGGQWRGLFKPMSGRYRLIAPDHTGRTPAYSGDIPLMEREIAIIEARPRACSKPGPFRPSTTDVVATASQCRFRGQQETHAPQQNDRHAASVAAPRDYA